MSKRCKHIKDNGQPCRRYVSAGEEYCYDHHPDRVICAEPGCSKTAMKGLSYCQLHRRDGPARAGFVPGHKTNRLNPNFIKSGFDTYPLTPDKLVDTVIRLELLFTYTDKVTDYKQYLRAATQLRRLYFRFNRELEKSDLDAQGIEDRIASGKAKAVEQLKAELAEHESLTKPQNPLRNALYHEILEYIEGYIKRNGEAPTLVEIDEALSIGHGTTLFYVAQLIEDKKLHKAADSRRRGRLLRLGPAPGEQLKLF